eukprot:TRINITY_DN44071_c0_g1_i1.p1 TRINITY_DN44071_c0_g1~~TRINITY_DN44071_c0_g1_i1.p1  ORF type:complete len:355 (-),score=41.30 TRINITY_DN44071_c0_g1_i1:102-1100(-)
MSAQVKGTCLVVSAACTFALVALVVKQDSIPSIAAAQSRFCLCWVMSMLFMLRYQKERGLKWFGPPEFSKLLFLRGAMTSGFLILWWEAIRRAPLGDCIALIYCSPLLTACLSKLLLAEPLLCIFPVQATLALTGMCTIVRPPFVEKLVTGQSVNAVKGDYSYVFGALLIAGFLPVLTKRTQKCSWIEVEHVSSFVAVFVIGPLSFVLRTFLSDDNLEVVQISAVGVGLILLASLGSFLGIAMQTQGYQMAEPGKATMFCYLEIPFAYVLQHVGTRDAVSINAFMGSSLIVISCLTGALAQLLAKEGKGTAGEKVDLGTSLLPDVVPKDDAA